MQELPMRNKRDIRRGACTEEKNCKKRLWWADARKCAGSQQEREEVALAPG